jgi:hypothetical protein
MYNHIKNLNDIQHWVGHLKKILFLPIIALLITVVSLLPHDAHATSPQIIFHDNYSSSAGWTQLGTQITVGSSQFPNMVKFNNVVGGGGTTEERVYKQLPSTLPTSNLVLDTTYEFSASNIPAAFPVVLSTDSQNPEPGVNSNIMIVHGWDVDQLLIRSSSAVSCPVPIAPNTPYYLRLERDSSQVLLMVFSDPARTVQVAGSPIALDLSSSALPNLNFIQHSGTLSGGSGRTITAQLTNTTIYEKTLSNGTISYPPGPPTGLIAVSLSTSQAKLSWSAPANYCGPPITNYKIYKSTSSGTETLLTTLGNVNSYTDNAVTNGTTYYYKVTAVNSVGESIPSNEAIDEVGTFHLKDSTTCAAIGGGLQYGTCYLFNSLTLNTGDSLTIDNGIDLEIIGSTINNHGTINISGHIYISCPGDTCTYAQINNYGTINSQPNSAIYNVWGDLDNYGTINNKAGALIDNNYGDCCGSRILNTNTGTINNSGNILGEPDGTISNSGYIIDNCGSTFTNQGSYAGNPVVYACGQTTTTTLTSSPNPSTPGQQVNFTATVSPSTATGTVTFTIDGTAQSPVPLSSGKASYSTSSLSVGTHSIMATYSGDTNNGNSTSSVLTQTVNKAITVTTLSSSPNPSRFSQQVNFTATVSPSTATGTVTFTIDGTAQSPVPLSSGKASYSTSSLSVGTHSIMATYSGDTNDVSSTSPTSTQTVTKVIITTTTLISSSNPSTFGTSVTFTATVSPSNATGTVTFTIDGTAQDTGALVGGKVSWSTYSLSAGTHSVTASYSGDTHDASSTSSTLMQTTNTVTTTTTLSINPISNVPWGKTITISGKLTSSSGAGLAGKTITFNGTGAVSFPNAVTDPNGFYSSSGAAPNTVTNGLTVQAHFAGDSQYHSTDSAVKTYNTLIHKTVFWSLNVPSSVTHGSKYSIDGKLKDSTTGLFLQSKTVTFSATSPIVIPSAVTDSTGKFSVSNLTAPAAGSYNIQAHFAGDSLYASNDSPTKVLKVT